MNTYEMEGFLRGKCVPRDLLVNESNAAYLVRKLSEIASVKAERDALADKCDRLEYNLGNAIVGEQEALQRVNGLAVENAGFKHALSVILEHVDVTDKGQAGVVAMIANDELFNSEAPATDAALAAIEARGVENFADCMLTLANDPTYSTASHRNDLRDAGAKAMNYATELREGRYEFTQPEI